MSARFADFAATLRAALAARWQVDSSTRWSTTRASVCTPSPTPRRRSSTLFNLHLKGVFFLTQALLPLLREGSRILNLSSGLTRSPCRAMRPMPA
jgi:NAD(P)-dependent dehydrogenase (short-subunit alcohol dehydrogenase family)